MCAMVSMWRSEKNLQESVLSFHLEGPEVKFRLSGLVAGTFTHRVTSSLKYCLMQRLEETTSLELKY